MITIRRDTILESGDLLTSPDGKDKWKVKSINGMKIKVVNPETNSEKILYKTELILNHWNLQIGNGRGYW